MNTAQDAGRRPTRAEQLLATELQLALAVRTLRDAQALGLIAAWSIAESDGTLHTEELEPRCGVSFVLPTGEERDFFADELADALTQASTCVLSGELAYPASDDDDGEATETDHVKPAAPSNG